MAYAAGRFVYVSGPLEVREYDVLSTATFGAGAPVMLNAAGVIRESLLTSTQIAGFALHSAANSVPAGKVLVVTPHAGTTFAIGGQTGFIGSQVSSGVTIGISKSGNTWSLDTTLSGSSKFFVIVPRGDGSTFDSTDSSVHFQVLLDANRPFNQSSLVAP